MLQRLFETSVPVYSPNMPLVEHMWDLVDQRLTLNELPVASEDLWLRIPAIWNSLPQADIQSPIPCHFT